MTDDGRLSAHDLDDLLGGSSGPVDLAMPADADLLAAGSHGPRWRERATSVARRHPMATAICGLAALLSAVVGVGFQLTRPPDLVPIDAQVMLEKTRALSGRALTVDDRLRADLTLQSADPEAALTAVALIGPGLEQPQVDQTGASVTTANRLNCADIPDLSAPGQYALRVSRTDAWDRTATSDLPVALSPEAVGVIARSCVNQAADLLELRAVAATDAGRVALVLEISNPTQRDLYVRFATALTHPAEAYLDSVDPDRVVAGRSATITLVPTGTDCLAKNTFRRSANFRSDGRRGGDLGLGVGAGADGNPRLDTVTFVQLAAAQQRAVEAVLGGSCEGAPELRSAVTDVADSPRRSGPRVDLTLTATAAAGTVNLRPNKVFVNAYEHTAEFSDSWQGPGRVVALNQPEIARTATIRLQWEVEDCGAALSGPHPVYCAVVRAGNRSYPYLVPINTPAVGRSLARTCG